MPASTAASSKRDVRYMQKTLDGILSVWAKYPELRLGQLLHIATSYEHYSQRGMENGGYVTRQDTFSIEDAALLKKLQDTDDRLSSRPK